MFLRNSKPDAVVPPAAAAATRNPASRADPPSILGNSLHVIGNLNSNGDIQIDGKVDGDIYSATLTVGESALVNGAIFGQHVRIAGTVNGEITAYSIELTETARVTGDMTHNSLSIKTGAYFQGISKQANADSLKNINVPKGAAVPAATVAAEETRQTAA